MTPTNKKAPMDKIASARAIVEYLTGHPGEDVDLDDLRLYVAKIAALTGFRPIGPQGIAATMCLIYRRSPLYAKLAPEGIVKVRAGVYHYEPQPDPKQPGATAPSAPKDDQPSLFPESSEAPSSLALMDMAKSLANIAEALYGLTGIFSRSHPELEISRVKRLS